MMAFRAFLRNHPLFFFFVTLGIALVGTIIVAFTILPLPRNNLLQLIAFMAGAGIITTLMSYAFYKWGLIQYMSIKWALLMTITFTVLLVLVNVWIIANLAFLDAYYIALTGVLLMFAGLTAVGFGFFVGRSMTDRISRLADASKQLAQGDLSTRLYAEGNDEIAYLTRQFNEMASNLQEIDEKKRQLEQTRRDLIAWVSHDLRTPLASLRVMIEAMYDGVVTDEATMQRYLLNSQNEIDHLNRLITDLFELAQLDVGDFKLDYQKSSLKQLIDDVIENMHIKAEQNNITLESVVDEGVDPVYMAPDKIQRVLYNLLDNAIKYTPEGDHVTVRASLRGKQVQIDVHNTGAYISSEALPHIFKSFYRVEKSRAQNKDGERGAGLGLAIARGFVEAHRGTIWVESEETSGTTFSFTIPHRTTARAASG